MAPEYVSVTFVGGPRHGEHARLVDPPATVDGQAASGERTVYAAMTWIGEGAWYFNRMVYAPTGMSPEDCLALLRTLPEPRF